MSVFWRQSFGQSSMKDVYKRQDLMASFNSLSLDNSATQGLQPVNQKLTTVTALPENRLSSTLLPSKSSPEKSLNTDEALELSFLLSSNDVFLFSSSAICSSIFRMVSISSLSVLSSSSVNEMCIRDRVFLYKQQPVLQMVQKSPAWAAKTKQPAVW